MAKTLKAKQLPSDRMSTTDEYGARVYLHPEDVVGKFRDLRTKVYWFLIAVYLILPWIHFHGKQSVLMDIVKREFTFFGNTFYGHDAPIIFFVLIGSTFFFAFMTSLLGRVWCGWACPQTVFIDAIFRRIERMVEGKSRARRDLARAPWSFEKLFKRSLKWALYTLVSLHIVHSFLGYFVGTHELVKMSIHAPTENWGTFLAMLICTGIILFDFGWFKEQFCIIACPYGRFQSVIMDPHSPVVAYDVKRGEPRRSPKIARPAEGDCIDCAHCIKVCPTGIDIRRGTQMECIACTMCIDACDEIMLKLQRPKGLIRYATEESLAGGKTKWIRPRVIMYLVILLVIASGFIYTLKNRGNISAVMLRGNKSGYQVVKTVNGVIIVNHYKIHFNNSSDQEYQLYFQLNPPELDSKIKLITPTVPFGLKKGFKFANVFFRFKKNVLTNGSRKIKLDILQNKNGKKIIISKEVNLVGPF